MIRKLLATTAVVTVLAMPTMAETQSPDDAGNEAANPALYIIDIDLIGDVSTRGYLASNLLGKYVYASAAEDADSVGDVNDMIIGETGGIEAVIVGVGGFLGIGEKDVAIPFDRLTMVEHGDNEMRVVTDVTREQLEGAEDYERPDYIPDVRSGPERAPLTDGDRIAMTDGDVDVRAQWFADKQEVDAGTLSADRLIGARVYADDLDDIGEVGDVVLTPSGEIDATIIDVGGFLGLGEKPVAVGFDQVTFYTDVNDMLMVVTPFTDEELEQAPAYDADAFESERDTMRLERTSG